MTSVDDLGHFQDPPRLRDEWEDDIALRRYLDRVLPDDVRREVEPSLAELGRLTANELYDLHTAMNRRENEPRLVRYDPWGRRIDYVETAPAWGEIGAIAARHGVVAAGYEDTFGEHARIHQFALAYLFTPSSGLYGCPLAMTDGAAKTLLVHGEGELRDRAVSRLTSRNPDEAWTSGQWMTERAGGSDVGQTETVATKDGQTWRLHGVKWFTSAVTADMALTLARPEGNPPGGRGLAMFYVEVRDEQGRANGIRVLRLKDKLGTRQVPTAELALEGTIAHLVGPTENGTKNITPMLHITRIWNAITAAAGCRRTLALARDYADRRVAFGRPIADQPLHQATLAEMRVEHEAALQLAFRAVELLGREEAGLTTGAESAALRLLTPIAKLITGKQGVAVASEGLEAFGGAGYIEDTNLPVLLRDAQVLPIWEGTTNVLALDVLRGIQREQALVPFIEEVTRHAELTSDSALTKIGEESLAACERAVGWLEETLAREDPAMIEHGARRFALTLGRALQAALLARQAQHDLDVFADGRARAVARRFAAAGIDRLDPLDDGRAIDTALAKDEPLPR